MDQRRAIPVELGLDRWLRFGPGVEARYDIECGHQRKAELCGAATLGVLLYNIYNFTSIVLLADVFWLSVGLRLAVVTPISLALMWLIRRSTTQQADRIALVGCFNAYLVPVFLFWISRNPLSLFTFGELQLMIVFANMLLVLRFRHAIAFTACVLGVTILVLCAKTGFDPFLRAALGLQIATACIVSLYANYRVERRRCLEYLATLDARMHADAAEEARRQSHDLAQIDHLTGLPNRRFLTERLAEWGACPESVAVLMIDVDYFKFYNDSFGHPAGDECLRIVARTLAARCEAPDVVATRYGGEEFIILVRGATRFDVVRFSLQLLDDIRLCALVHPARPDKSKIVTASIGIAYRSDDTVMRQDDLLASADRALYRAKQTGRNRVVLDESPAEQVAKSA